MVSSVSKLWGLCWIEQRHKGDCSPTESATGQTGAKHQKHWGWSNFQISGQRREELSSLLLGIALGMSTFGCTSR